MIGAIIGDIAGSWFEWDNYRAKDFDLLSDKCFFTDDSIMSLAVCDALLKTVPSYKGLSRQAVLSMQKIGRPYPRAATADSSTTGSTPMTPNPTAALETAQP